MAKQTKTTGAAPERGITIASIIHEWIEEYSGTEETHTSRQEAIHEKGIDIGIYSTNFEREFISLTDIAKCRNEDDPRFAIQNWMRNRTQQNF